jgi:membrane protease YdiL (CAAX protease family)
MLSEKPWNGEAVLRLFLGIISTVCLGLCLAGLVESAKSGWSDDQRLFVQMIATAIFFQIAALIWIGFFLRAAHTTWRQAFGWCAPGTFRAVALGILAGIAILPVAILLQESSSHLMELMRIKPEMQTVVQELQKPRVPWFETAFLGVLAVCIAPVAEEVMFRGILYPTVKQLGYPRLALWGTSLLFGLSHFSMVTLAPLTVFAAVLVFLYETTDNLLAPIVAHSLFNAMNFFILVFAHSLDRFLPFK